jgi:hypothetical protein
VNLRSDLDTEVGGEILCLCRGSNPDRLMVRSQTLYSLTYPGFSSRIGLSHAEKSFLAYITLKSSQIRNLWIQTNPTQHCNHCSLRVGLTCYLLRRSIT